MSGCSRYPSIFLRCGDEHGGAWTRHGLLGVLGGLCEGSFGLVGGLHDLTIGLDLFLVEELVHAHLAGHGVGVDGLRLVSRVVSRGLGLNFPTAMFASLRVLAMSWLGSSRFLATIQATPDQLLFDFEAAFPSVMHKWLHSMMEKVRAPLGITRAIRRMCDRNYAFLESSWAIGYIV